MPRVSVSLLVLAPLFGLLGLSACTSGGRVASAEGVDPSPPYNLAANARQTMLWILDPAADVIWDSAGFIITAQGETDLQPTTDAGWEHVRNSAALVAETGNLLMMPGRSSGPDWVRYSGELTAAAKLAMAAADARDADALFDAGGELYQACRACHDQYMVPLLEARRAQ